MSNGVVISAAVEGLLDEAAVRKLITHVGATPGDVHGRQGKTFLRQRIAGYNHAARHAPWIVLVDLDRTADCAPPLRAAWIPAPSAQLCFRVAVRKVEAWLLADRERLAEFLSVARSRLPHDPEQLDDPKVEMVNVARGSHRRAVRDDMVPRPEGGRAVGPAYSSQLIEFITSHWRPAQAAECSDSLRRAIACLRRLAAAV